jgi:hypothetical protein
MRERVEALGGTLRLSGAPGATRVVACVPLAVAAPSTPPEVDHE